MSDNDTETVEAAESVEVEAQVGPTDAEAQAASDHLELRVSELVGYLRMEATRTGADANALGEAFTNRLAELLQG